MPLALVWYRYNTMPAAGVRPSARSTVPLMTIRSPGSFGPATRATGERSISRSVIMCVEMRAGADR
jgi:hypothetical protein